MIITDRNGENPNKVLLLSLGKGNEVKDDSINAINQQLSNWFNGRNDSPEEIIKKSGKGNRQASAYVVTTYAFRGKYTTSSFVAEPLINAIKPDHVVVIGSIRSAWSSFYLKFASNPSEEGYKELYNIEIGEKYIINGKELIEKELTVNDGCGIQTGGAELDQYEAKINQIFEKADWIMSTNGHIQCQIILIRYGLDSEQLDENYGRFKNIKRALKKDKRNEVSFDTTHSFRFIPLYNLVLLNYIETIEDYDIQIKHVFNGCLDARYENKVNVNGEIRTVAPIIDLYSIIGLLELTDAVREFINTGNAVALTSSKNSNEDKFLKDLSYFDWATQLNDFNKIEDSIGRLALHESVIATNADHEENENTSIISDRTKMILSVICRRMMGTRSLSEFTRLSSAEKRLVIAEWYLEQNRYGQCIATAIEAMRSMLAPYYLEQRNMPQDEDKLENENYRRNAESKLCGVMEYLNSTGERYDVDSLENVIIKVAELFQSARTIRNTFAHNLKSEVKINTEMDIVPGIDSKAIIEEYLRYLRKLNEIINEDKDRFKILYGKDIKLAHNHKSDKNDTRIKGAVVYINFLDHSEIQEALLAKKISGFNKAQSQNLWDLGFRT